MNDYQLALQCQDVYNGKIPLKTVNGVDFSIVENDDAIDIIFRGTSDWRDAIRDLEALMIDCPFGRVHKGAWEGVTEAIDFCLPSLSPDKPTRLSGHSLGAMRAQMGACSLYLRGYRNIEVVTFASPRWGNADAIKYYLQIKNRTYRNYKDMWVYDFFTTIPVWLPTLPFQLVPNDTVFWSAPTPENEWRTALENIQAHSLKDCYLPALQKLCQSLS